MEQLQLYFRMLKKGWWLIALAALAAFNIALLVAYNSKPMYRASARFIVSPGPSLLAGQDKEVVNSIEALDKRSIVSTYAEVLNSNSIYEATINNLGLDPVEFAEYTQSAVVLPDASVLELTVQGPDPEMVALLANEVGSQSIDYIEGLYLVYDINLLDPATPPTTPFSPQPARDAAVALILGAALGAVLAIVREYFKSPLDNLRRGMMADEESNSYNRRFVQKELGTLLNASSESVSLGLVSIQNGEILREKLSFWQWRDLLRQFAELLRGELRGKDLVGRWDAAQFAVVLPDVDEETAVQMLESIHNKLTQPLTVDGAPLDLQLKSGIATATGDEDVDGLIEQAEIAQKRAARGTTPIVLYNAQMKPTAVLSHPTSQPTIAVTETTS